MAGDNLLNNLPKEEALQLLDQKKPGIKVRDNLEILEKSDVRQEVDCTTYKRCGGCRKGYRPGNRRT